MLDRFLLLVASLTGKVTHWPQNTSEEPVTGESQERGNYSIACLFLIGGGAPMVELVLVLDLLKVTLKYNGTRRC